MLRKNSLDVDISFTQARMLYEIEAGQQVTALSLREGVELSASFVRWALGFLRDDDCVVQSGSKGDGRHKLITRSVKGRLRLDHFEPEVKRTDSGRAEPLSAKSRRWVTSAWLRPSA